MNFNKLKENIIQLAKTRKTTVKALLEKVGMSEAGFYRAIQNDSLKLSMVNSIAEALNVSLTDLLAETTVEGSRPLLHAKNNLNHNNVQIGDKNKGNITNYEDCMGRLKIIETELQAKMNEIKLMQTIIDTKDQLILSLSK